MFSRRKSKRLEIAIPINIKLLGTSKHPPHISAFTKNISPLGISTDLQVSLTNGVFLIHEGTVRVNLIPYLVLETKRVEVNITIPPHEEKIKAKGNLTWYDFSSRESLYFFRAGIFLNEMEAEDRKRWEEFIRNTALETGKIWQNIQVISTFSFVAGIIIFIAGFCGELAKTAKIGIFFSFIGLIGFILAWWQHRSFMLLKKFKWF